MKQRANWSSQSLTQSLTRSEYQIEVEMVEDPSDSQLTADFLSERDKKLEICY